MKTSDGQILQGEMAWGQDRWHYAQTNYFNLNAPTAYDTLKTWDIEINGYNGGASLLGLSATVTSTGYPKLTWDKVEGADKYEVWRKVGSDGTYAKQYTTTGTSYTNTSVTKGKYYYYKVKAVYDGKSAANSAYSNMDYAYVR